MAIAAWLTPSLSSAQGVEAWVRLFDGPAHSLDVAVANAVDANGNVFVTGYSVTSITTFLNYDYVTIAYSNAGTPLWTNRYDGPGALDFATAIVVDSSGNVFVSGYSASTNGSPYNFDYATIKYSNAGVPLWTNRYDGPSNGYDAPAAIAVDGNGDVVVTGMSAGAGNDYSDYATVKYSSAGVPLWTNRFSEGSDDRAVDVGLDKNGKVFVTGLSRMSIVSFATIAYSSAGVPVWTNRYIRPGGGVPAALAVDSSGDVIVTGSSLQFGSDFADYTTLKYSNAGVPLWTNLYDGPNNGDDNATAIAVDSADNIFVTGYCEIYRDMLGPDYETTTLKYSSSGVSLWTNRYGSVWGPFSDGLDDAPTAIAVGNNGNVFVTGYTYSIFDPYDFVTIAYSNAGVPLWTNTYAGPAGDWDQAKAISVDSSGNVFVSGYSSASVGDSDFTTIKYSTGPPPTWLTIQVMNNHAVLTWTNAMFGLQTAPSPSGTFTNIPGATSPYTNSIINSEQYFRLISN